MVALENSNKFAFSKGEEKRMPLGSTVSKIHSLEGCGIVNVRSGSRPGIISRAVLPAPWCLSTWVNHPSSARWSCHLSHPSGKQPAFCTSFLLEEKCWQLSGPSEPTWEEFVETQRRKCLKNKKTRRQRNEKICFLSFLKLNPFHFWLTPLRQRRGKGDHRGNENTSIQPCTLAL